MRCEVIEREGVKYNDNIHIITIIMIIYTLFLSIHTQIYHFSIIISASSYKWRCWCQVGTYVDLNRFGLLSNSHDAALLVVRSHMVFPNADFD